jgi:hypothetical protein
MTSPIPTEVREPGRDRGEVHGEEAWRADTNATAEPSTGVTDPCFENGPWGFLRKSTRR